MNKPRIWVFIDDSVTKDKKDMAMYIATTRQDFTEYISWIFKRLKRHGNKKNIRNFLSKPKFLIIYFYQHLIRK